MNTSEQLYTGFRSKWLRTQWIQAFLFSVALVLPLFFGGLSFLVVLLIFTSIFGVFLYILKPWNVSQNEITGFLDQKLQASEHSSFLLLQPALELSGLAQLQQQKITQQLHKEISSIHPPNQWKRISLFLACSILLSILAFIYKPFENLFSTYDHKLPAQKMVFTPTDSIKTKSITPKVVKQSISIQYPQYTKKPVFISDQMNIKALAGSKIKLTVQFSDSVKKVEMVRSNQTDNFTFKNNQYGYQWTVKTADVYNLKFQNTAGNTFISDVYQIEMATDQPPIIKISDLKQFSSFQYNDDKKLKVNAQLTDDYGLNTAYIVATISRGSGESVKFREEKINFDNNVEKDSKKSIAKKQISLDALKMTPGDELYFYVEAFDNKQPKPNKVRSDTYFAVIKDTITDSFQVEQTSAVDRMPAYFKSQRQLIIDTEKLIEEKSHISAKEFKSRSNELGYDQKSLRIKYGAFMGDESDFEISSAENEAIDHEDHDHEEDEHHDEDGHNDEDLLDEYSHKHDTENEHNLVSHNDHEHEGEAHDDEEAEDPLHDYLHNHDNPEESTLFTQSLKSKLRQAMTEMWDSELHLRIYEPKKSLPYQYRALKLLQEIKNSARIYVHRIGFDPPPIKEEKRLSGKLDEVNSYTKKEELTTDDCCENIKKAIVQLDSLLTENRTLNEIEKVIFENAGTELAAIALENPGKHLSTLQQLKLVIDASKPSQKMIKQTREGLYSALPNQSDMLYKNESFSNPLHQLILEALSTNE